MEFFLLVLKQVCQNLKLSIAIGSKTVGKEVGRQDNAVKLARVMENWRQVWARDEVREKEALVLPVAVDERNVPQDWVCVVVRSIGTGEKLRDAKQLLVQVYDPAKRASASSRLARNVDVLVRGVGAQVGAAEPRVEFLEAPECRVGSQSSLRALGLVMVHVARAAQEAGATMPEQHQSSARAAPRSPPQDSGVRVVLESPSSGTREQLQPGPPGVSWGLLAPPGSSHDKTLNIT